jgi:Uma2 family endonuclease
MSTAALLTEPLYHYHLELIDGHEIEKPLPRKLHILIQRYLMLLLTNQLPAHYMAMPELSVLTGGRTASGRREYIVPDLQIVERTAQYEDGDLAVPPIWGVEILSPGQTIGDLFVRAERLLKVGAPMVWVIWPEKRKAWMYSPSELVEATNTLKAPLPGTQGAEPDFIEIQTHAMWAELD